MDPNSMMDKKKAYYYMQNRRSTERDDTSAPRHRGQGENAGTRLFKVIFLLSLYQSSCAGSGLFFSRGSA